MEATPGRAANGGSRAQSRTRRLLRVCLSVVLLTAALGGVGVASAHDSENHSHSSTEWYGPAMSVVGVGLLIGTIAAERTDRLSPAQATVGVAVGVVVAGLGVMLL